MEESDIKTGRATHAQKLLPPKPTHHSRRQNNQTHLFQCNLLPQPFLKRLLEITSCGTLFLLVEGFAFEIIKQFLFLFMNVFHLLF
jgi:hypothetical protein